MIKYSLILLAFLSICSCDNDASLSSVGKVMGYKPIYISDAEVRKIELQPARELKSPGKIYVKGDFLYVVENLEGIHVIDNKDPKNPIFLKFLKIRCNKDIEMKGNVLYADNGLDLVAINMANPESASVLKRIENVFPYTTFPPFENVKFECPDKTKGQVFSWEYVELENPKCYR